MHFIRRLMAQKIAVCPGLPESPVAFHGSFPDGQGHGTFRILFFHATDDLLHPFVGVIGIFPSLQYKCPESQLITIFAASENFFLRQTVTLRIPVIPADPAVITVIFTVIGKLNEPSGVDLIPIIFLSDLHRALRQRLPRLRIVRTADQLHKLFFLKILILQKLLCDFLHDLPSPNRHSHPGNYIPCRPCGNR